MPLPRGSLSIRGANRLYRTRAFRLGFIWDGSQLASKYEVRGVRTGPVHAATARPQQPYLVRYRTMDVWSPSQERRGCRSGGTDAEGRQEPKQSIEFCRFRLGSTGLERQTLYDSAAIRHSGPSGGGYRGLF